uniref:Mediator of RNA polymerase II transcription subunit 4 n=1 Tax=Bionectria ochroleuca TaxID=29856 RepID=A0A8H7N3P4_BIOOC
MDKYIDGRFERLEKALAVLVDSVNKYHPSIAHAKEIELADSELSKGLEDVQTHQNNYLRIQELRKSSAALDSQIRDTLSSLASTRKDIVTTHATTFPPGQATPSRTRSSSTTPAASARPPCPRRP